MKCNLKIVVPNHMLPKYIDAIVRTQEIEYEPRMGANIVYFVHFILIRKKKSTHTPISNCSDGN